MAEAKLRAIYDALEARNPKQAIKLCNTLLAKANYPLVKALKALAFERVGKSGEALSLAREAVQSQQGDETTLSTLSIVFQAQGRPEEITAAYVRAFERRPDSEEIAVQLFSCHMRAHAYPQAQVLALKMYKSFAKNAALYLSWAVTTLLLQADDLAPGAIPAVDTDSRSDGGERGPGATNGEKGESAMNAQRMKLLKLAAAMMGREAVKHEGDLQLRLLVFRHLGDNAAALALIDEHESLFCTSAERIRTKATLLEAEGRWEEAKAAHREVLTRHACDDWHAHLGYMQMAVRLSGTAAREDVGALLDTLRSACAGKGRDGASRTLCSPSEEISAVPGTGRGVWLAAVELESILLSSVRRDSDSGSFLSTAYAPLTDALVCYFERFSHKPSCVHDVLPYLHDLPLDVAAMLVSRIELAIGAAPSAEAQPADRLTWLRRFVCACEWRLAAGIGSEGAGAAAAEGVDMADSPVQAANVTSSSSLRGLASSWLAIHASYLPISAGNDPRERGHADVLPVLAAEAIMARSPVEWYFTPDKSLEEWRLPDGSAGADNIPEAALQCADRVPSSPRATDVELALLAAAALQQGLNASPHNGQIAMALATAMNCIGAPVQALRLFKQADTKQIQHHSLSHIVLPAAFELGASGNVLAINQLRYSRRWQEDGIKDISDSMLLALKEANPAQVLEFAAFERCIRTGWWSSLLSVLDLIASLCNLASSPMSESRAAFANISPLLVDTFSSTSTHAMPDTIDLESFEAHWPLVSAGGDHTKAISPSLPNGSSGAAAALTRAPPPAVIATARALRQAWLPRRQRLLRFIALALGAAAVADGTMAQVSAAELFAAEASLREACDGTLSEAAISSPLLPRGEEASWAGILAAARVTRIVIENFGEIVQDPKPADAVVDQIQLAVRSLSIAISAATGALREAMCAAGGFTPRSQRQLAHLATLEVPVVCILQARCMEVLSTTASAKASRLRAEAATVMSALAEAGAGMGTAMQALAETLNGKKDTDGTYTPGPASAARCLIDAGALNMFLPRVAEGACAGNGVELLPPPSENVARQLKEALRESEGACLSRCREALQSAAVFLAAAGTQN